MAALANVSNPKGIGRLPENLSRLHTFEEELREKAIRFVDSDEALKLHIRVTEAAMELADVFRQYGSDSEDIKVIRIFGMRCFNSFASALKLVMSGYSQTSALVLRDVLETVFLIDLFRTQHSFIAEWRFADKKTLRERFSPASVRKALDKRDGNTDGKREKLYTLFCELAGHPTMKSDWMLRPQKDADALIGPFIEKEPLTAVLSEMGKLAIQAGELLNQFVDQKNLTTQISRLEFARAKSDWIKYFSS
jgi:hypothetical protein